MADIDDARRAEIIAELQRRGVPIPAGYAPAPASSTESVTAPAPQEPQAPTEDAPYNPSSAGPEPTTSATEPVAGNTFARFNEALGLFALRSADEIRRRWSARASD